MPAPNETPRQAIRRHLTTRPCTARDLSSLVGIPEKAVAAHLEHLARSLQSTGGRLDVVPTRCLDCDYVFADRTRFTKPSACPRCRGQHLTAPSFSIQPATEPRPRRSR